MFLHSQPLNWEGWHAGVWTSCSCPHAACLCKQAGHTRIPPQRPRQRLRQVVEAYGCSLVEGVLTHQLKRFIIDGNKVVLNRGLPDLKAEDSQFEENEVYGIDILVSSGEGKARVTDERETTVSPPASSLLGKQKQTVQFFGAGRGALCVGGTSHGRKVV